MLSGSRGPSFVQSRLLTVSLRCLGCLPQGPSFCPWVLMKVNDPVFQAISIGLEGKGFWALCGPDKAGLDRLHWLQSQLGSLCQKREGQSHRALGLYRPSDRVCPGTMAG